MKKLYTLSFVLLATMTSFGQVVISQVYGGGGNTGAQFSNDFIELFNRGTVAQSLNGWSVQYTSAAGPSATAPNTNWTTTLLPNVTLQPGKYFLIQQAAGTTASTALPTPDFNGICATCTLNADGTPLTTGIAMSGSNGKVILVNVVTQQTTANPTGPQIVDKVGYGGSTVNGFEGTGPTGAALTNTTAATRKSAGCIDTDSNPSDFESIAPNPRNSATAALNCATASTQNNSIAGLSIYPNPATDGQVFISSDANETKSVVIFDLLGKQVLNTKTSGETINIAALTIGAYFVKVTENGKIATRKLLVQ